MDVLFIDQDSFNNIDLVYLFSWNEIPGNDDKRLKEYLIKNYGIDWVKTAKIEKIDSDKTIKVFTEDNCLSLKLNDEETKVYLKIDDCRTHEFIVKKENNKLNIYDPVNIDKLEFEYEQLWENIKHNSNLAYTVLGVSLPASAYILYLVKFGAGSTIKLSSIQIIFLAIASILIAIAGYGIYARLNYKIDKLEKQSIEIEEKLGMYIIRYNDEEKLPLMLKKEVENIYKCKLHWSERPFRKFRITYWYLIYIVLLFLGWIFLKIYHDPIDTTLTNLPISNGNFIIGNIANNTNSTINLDNFTVGVR